MIDLIFYLLAFVLIALSLLVVAARNLLNAALALIGTFFATAALYLLLHMEFTALAQVMVYIGGIVVFMVITILLTGRIGERNLFPKTAGQRLWGLGVSLVFFSLLWSASRHFELPAGPPPWAADAGAGSLAAVGRRLLSPEVGGFVIPFEVISFLLVAALIGAVVIARRDDHRETGGEPEKTETGPNPPKNTGPHPESDNAGSRSTP